MPMMPGDVVMNESRPEPSDAGTDLSQPGWDGDQLDYN
jgi:hypothetical protein